MNSVNWETFGSIAMFIDEKDHSVNFEHLWSLNDTDGGDPAANSLFNITTL